MALTFDKLSTFCSLVFLFLFNFGIGVDARREDPAQFVLTQSEYNPAISLLDDALKRVPLTHVLDNSKNELSEASNEMRETPWFLKGFRWSQKDPEDEGNAYWDPQGIATSYDTDFQRGIFEGNSHVIMVSWNDVRNRTGHSTSPGQGVRISMIRKGAEDAAVANRAYAHVLLVEPYIKEDKKTPDYRALENVNSGGIVWRGNWLYVTDDLLGLRVFDLNHTYKVATSPASTDTIGLSGKKYYGGQYDYVIPQAFTYSLEPNSTRLFRPVSASLDRSNDTIGLMLGESTSDNKNSTFVRFNLNNNTNLIYDTTAVWAWETNMSDAEGIVWVPGVDQYFITVSHGDDVGSNLHRWTPGSYSSQYNNWLPAGAQGLAYRPATPGELWVIGSIPGKRYVMALNTEMHNLTETTTPTPTPTPTSITSQTPQTSAKVTPSVIAGAVIGGFAALLLGIGATILVYRRRINHITEAGFVKPELEGCEKKSIEIVCKPISYAEMDGGHVGTELQ